MAEKFLEGVPDGLRVLVTAGAAGIGRVIADTFLAHGARVHACDVDAAAVAEFDDSHPNASATQADVSDRAQIDALFADLAERFGGLDVLVNNAGIAGPTAGVDQIDPDAWDQTVDINMSGQFNCARRAAPLLRATGDGAMINIASVAGRLGYAYRLPYAATKWGVVGMTASLAKELGPDGVRVNALLPGIVEGPRIDRVIADRAQTVGVSFEEMKQQYRDKASLRRMVSAQDVADMALFLCSRHGRNISGQPISVCANVETL
ncbi:SDR family oxidoreductase [Rhodovibrio salinarum]|uniref:NAD(P)-dependent oxidoreductase n=1 Tax=Rhodovibrio salinarum TaxID=1087 RepID=A0A934QMG9_9PROT|nr:SDR family oxidoreductase [Rhodovibrio salinarum]MBK1699125.1 NAD(P)-dependent oxidoreductase [Rhodovibrio salinarum]